MLIALNNKADVLYTTGMQIGQGSFGQTLYILTPFPKDTPVLVSARLPSGALLNSTMAGGVSAEAAEGFSATWVAGNETASVYGWIIPAGLTSQSGTVTLSMHSYDGELTHVSGTVTLLVTEQIGVAVDNLIADLTAVVEGADADANTLAKQILDTLSTVKSGFNGAVEAFEADLAATETALRASNAAGERLRAYDASFKLKHGWNTVTLIHLPVKAADGTITNLRTYVKLGALDTTAQTQSALISGLPYCNWGVANTFVNARQNQVFRPFDDVYQISQSLGLETSVNSDHPLKLKSFKFYTLDEDAAGTITPNSKYDSDSIWTDAFNLVRQYYGAPTYIVLTQANDGSVAYEDIMDQTIISCEGGPTPVINATDKSIQINSSGVNNSFFQWTHNATWSRLSFPTHDNDGNALEQPEMVAQSFDVYFGGNFPGLRIHSDNPYAVIDTDGTLYMVNSARPIGIEVSRVEMDARHAFKGVADALSVVNSVASGAITDLALAYNAQDGTLAVGKSETDITSGTYLDTVALPLPAVQADVASLKGLHLVIDNTNFTIELQDANGTVYGEKIDLPLETVVVGGSYAGGTVTLTLTNGSSISFDVSSLVSGLVAETRTINGKPLTSDITLTANDIEGVLTTDSVVTAVEEGATGIPTAGAVHTAIVEAVSSADINTDGLVPTTRTINGKALSADITLTAGDVGAMSALDVQDAIDTAIDTAITTALNTEV